MPLPDDYDSPDGEAEAELVIRQTLGERFLEMGSEFGFTEELVHDRPRYPRLDSVWESIGTIEDPETTGNDSQSRLTRYCSFKFKGFREAGEQELLLFYEFNLSFGFKDEYATDPTKNSTNDMVACAMKFRRHLKSNKNLGLDDRVTLRQFEVYESLPILDKQGVTDTVLFGRLEVMLNVCSF